jgi:uncharacterized protein (TIGR00255 family)
VEIRSVNGRFLDLALRLPDELRGLEPALRELVGAALRRGKVELRLATQRATGDGLAAAHARAAEPAVAAGIAGAELAAAGRRLSVNEVLQWCRGGGGAERLDDSALEAARRCIAGLREARAREGARLATMLMERVRPLRELAGGPRRWCRRWCSASSSASWNAGTKRWQRPGRPALPAQALQERALNEAAAFAIRIDVAEELTRLAPHLDEIERLLKAGGELGKRLDFLIQELQREANTLGSKSPRWN